MTLADQPLFPALDGLRAIAVVMVVAHHLHWLPGGYLGVDVFFSLSGFLITRILLGELGQTGTIGLVRFAWRRMWRLSPALLVFVAVVAAAYSVAPDAYGSGFRPRWALSALTYTANLRPAFGAEWPIGLVGQTWSLAMEEQFYLLWPLALFLASRASAPRVLAAVVPCTIAVAALVARVVTVADGPTEAALNLVYFSPWNRMDGMALGCAAGAASFSSGRPLPPVFPTAAAFVIGLLAVVLPIRVAAASPIAFTATSAASAVLVYGLAHGTSGLGRLLSGDRAGWLGRRSYGLYLWHPLAIANGGLSAALLGDASGLVESVVAVTMSIWMAWASYRFVEEPLRRVGHQPPAVLLARAIGAVSRSTQ